MTARNRLSVIAVIGLGLLATFAAWPTFGASATADRATARQPASVAPDRPPAGAIMVTSESHYGHILPRSKGGYYQQIDQQWWLCSPDHRPLKRVSVDQIFKELFDEIDRDQARFDRDYSQTNGWPACLL